MADMKRCSSLLVTISLMVFTPTVFAQSACSGGSLSLTANGFAQNLTSPNYPGLYPAYSNCEWIITAASASQVVVLNVLDFSLETSAPSCIYDYVTLYDGTSSYFSTIQKFCIQPLITQFVSTGSSMTVAFYSDSSSSFRGFKFEYTSQNKSALCGNAALSATLTAKNFYSPGYNYKYPNDMDCQWTINADSYQRMVVLNVLNMYLQGGLPDCTDDYLSVYDGNSTNSSKIQTLCGQVSSYQIASTSSSMTVVFHSDDRSSFKGFQFQYTSSYASATCGSTINLVANASTQYLSSPNYPFNYPNNMNCQWIISTSGVSHVILLRVKYFNLEVSPTCNFDKVTIYDGYGTSPTVLTTMCGTPSTTQISSTGSYMTVVFQSDSSHTFTGFKFEYTSQNSSAVCSRSALTATSSAQYITSPNYPNYYLSNTDCTWVITASLSSQVVVLKLIDFYLEGPSTSCSGAYDYVTIYDGSSTSSTSLQKLCGLQTTTTQFVSSGSSMTVIFHSDLSYNYRGFKLQYTSSALSDICSAQSLTATSTTSYLTSPNYPGLYPNNINCEWHISASLGSYVVVLQLISLSLEGNGFPCSNDYVYIYDGSSKYSTQITSLCGTKYSGTYSSSGSYMTVVFRSDSSVQNSGFRFSYKSKEKSKSSSSLSAGAIVGIVFCCIGVPCIIMAIVIRYRKHTTQQQIQNNPNRAQVQTARTTTAAPAVSYVTNNPPAVPAPYMMQNPPQMMPMGAPAYTTNYLPPPYSYAMQQGAVPQGQTPSGAPGPSNIVAASTQNNRSHINNGFTGDSTPTVPS